MTKDEMKNRISMALKDPILQQGFEIICKNLTDLEKENAELREKWLQATDEGTSWAHRKSLEQENAELKDELKRWKDEWQEQVQKATDEGYARTLQTIQLTKAKELLEELYDCIPASSADYYKETLQKVADFLKDSEVEK